MLSSIFTRRASARARSLRSPGIVGLASVTVAIGLVSGVDALAGTTRTTPLERAAAPGHGAESPTTAIALPAPLRRATAAPAVPRHAARTAMKVATVPKPGPLPAGMGMWIWEPEQAEGGNARAIVAKAKKVGLTHIYVRTGSSWQGFHGRQILHELLPLAHANAIRVYGWDFPNLRDVRTDFYRSLKAIRFRSPGGHRIDGFVPDLETPSEGTHSTASRIASYTSQLRAAVGAHYPLIGCVPRPSSYLLKRGWPYAEAIRHMSAVAPMVYWLNRQPDSDVAGAISYLRRFDKPIIPVGQAYDGGPEGGRPGPPPAHEITRFIVTAQRRGAIGVSFWSWQHASGQIWAAINRAKVYNRSASGGPQATPHAIATLQRSLGRLGYPVPITARWDPMTAEVLRVLQREKGVRTTGRLDTRTQSALVRSGLRLPASLLRRER